MEIFNSNNSIFGLKSPVRIGKRQNQSRLTSFGQGQDSFVSNPITTLCNEQKIKQSIEKNPQIRNILKQHSIPIKLNMTELNNLMQNHAQETKTIAKGITSNLPANLKNLVNLEDLCNGALLHDFGKVLIPEKVLNKPGSLTPDETEIVQLHSELGYELLKNSGINAKVLDLVKNHHNKNASNMDIHLQILNLADEYSALVEKRPYKEAFSPQKALNIIYNQEIKTGNINPLVFNALVKYVLV